MSMNQVYSIHSDFYYVKCGNSILECKLREVLKKRKTQVCTGDFVELEGNIIKSTLERKNFLKRPSVANIDKVAVVSALKEPELDFTQLDRYLTFFKYHNIPAILCFNKEDLNDDTHLKGKIEEIYKLLGYGIFFTSARLGIGIEEFQKSIKGQTVVLAGQSGVGKSSILNAIHPSFNLKTSEVSQKHGRGVHTTRHCEIIEFNDIKIVDTPGFSQLRFDFLMPRELDGFFNDIKKYKENCKFSDCLHDESQNAASCAVIKNMENIHSSRYESYLTFLSETKEHKAKVTYNGTKVESKVKSSGGQLRVKINNKKRADARNTTNQKIKKELDR
ncbi:ribosome biogenesis GTPase [Candidatus Gastranaerophilus sp. (ex Termes propinquus)]|nr:ribosome biogenesis GTPase [Candidatus Gastranaerophilus sp. (ex Termes propinquus)]